MLQPGEPDSPPNVPKEEKTVPNPGVNLEGVAVDLEGVDVPDITSKAIPEPGPSGFSRPKRTRQAPDRLDE